MLTVNSLKHIGLALTLLVAPLLSDCAWREGPPCDDVMIDDGVSRDRDDDGTAGGTGTGADVSGLEDKIADLERRLAANERLADSAMMTAEKALKCCREDYSILATEHIHFDFNRTEIRPGDALILDRVAERLKASPELIAELSGFADAVGNPDYNMALGQRRAESARNYLTSKHGIAATRMTLRTFGESAAVHPPTADEKTRESDRRVTIDMLGYGTN